MVAQICDTQILQKVEQFYQHSWSMLVATLVIGLAVVGIILPAVIAWLQGRSFKREKEAILAETARQIGANREIYERDLQQAMAQKYKQINHHSAMHWYEMAQTAIETHGAAWQHAWRYWFYAIDGALEAAWPPDEPRWEWLVECLGKFQTAGGAKDIVRMPHTQESLFNTISSLRRRPRVYPYSTLISKLQSLLIPADKGA